MAEGRERRRFEVLGFKARISWGILSLVALTTHLPAQTSAFTYQGSLSDNGSPAAGNHDLRFRIYDAAANGNAVGEPLTNSAVALANGLFTTSLDFGAGVFDGGNRWLEIGVRPAGSANDFTTLTPRQPLTATPYAVKALEASAVPQGTITSAMLADGAVTSGKIAPGAVNQLGSPDGAPLSALQVNTNGLVGIGTNAPQAGLHITSNQDVQITHPLSVRVDGLSGFNYLNGAISVATQGNLVAVASPGDSAITLMELNYLGSPVLRSQLYYGLDGYGRLYGASSVAMESNLLVVASSLSDSLTFVDVSNPSNSVKLADLRDGLNGWNELNEISSVAISGNLLAVGAARDSAVTLVDISNPAAPTKLFEIKNGAAGFDNLRNVQSVALSGTLLAVGAADSRFVTLVDVTNPSSPTLLAEYPLSAVEDIALADGLLAAAAYYDNVVTLIDVSNPANPTPLCVLGHGLNGDSLFGVTSVAFSGNRLAVASGAVTFFDVSNPSSPLILADARQGVGGFGNLVGGKGIAFSGERLVVAANYSHAVTVMGLFPASVGLAIQDRVGIGTTQPAAALHVMGNVQVDQAARIDLNANIVELGRDTAATGIYSTAMGRETTASGESSTSIGFNTLASGTYATAMGWNSIASGYVSTAMGDTTIASAYASTAFGDSTRAIGVGATALGFDTTAGGVVATAMGFKTVANGDFSTATGYLTSAIGDSSTAMGHHAKANHQGTFVWGDSVEANLVSAAKNEFTTRASGGYRLFSDSTATAGVSLAASATAWSVISDRAVKKDFATVDARAVLEKLAAVPVQRWHYQWEAADATAHLGPVAQDFKAAFYPGRDDKSITTLEFDGVALAAIQGLNQKLEDELEQKQTEITELQRQNAELLKRLEAIETRLK